MDKRPIGIFDSGVGGLTVLKELQELMPNEDYIYIGDTASFPYGSKSKQTIIELSKKRIDNLIDMNAKIIVIACGTATSQALEEMKKIFNIPIIGIIQPTVEYLEEKNIKNIGVIATTGTIRSEGWKKQIEKEIMGAKTINKACALLAPMAEEGWVDNEIAKLTIKEYIKYFPKLDALILGCTHYPFIKKQIRKVLGDVPFYDGNHGTVMELKRRLEINGLLTNNHNNGIIEFQSSKNNVEELQLYKWFYNQEI